MNTERPDHDGAEARTSPGSARDTGSAPGGDGETSAPERRPHRERQAPASPDAGTTEPPEAAEVAAGEVPEAETTAGEVPDTKTTTDEAPETKTTTGEAPETKTTTGEAPETKTTADETPEAETGGDPIGARSVEADTGVAGAPDGEADTGADGAGDRSAEGPGGPGAPEAPPRRRSPALIAAVAAVLLVGGGGAYLASGASGGSGGGTAPGTNGDATPPPLALDGFSEGSGPGIAPGEPNPYGATYRADGALPDGPDSAPVYRTRGEVTREQVTGLAKALGIEGKPVAEGEGWRIGGKDGSGPTLRVDRAAPGAWSFHRYAPGPDTCKGKVCEAPSTGGPVVSEEVARKAAAPVLKAVGQDDAKLDASQVMGGSRVVNADPEIGGLPTYGWTTGVVVGARGEVVGGSGRLAAPVKGDTYPVVGAEEALQSLNAAPGAGRHPGIGGCASPVPLEEEGRQEPCGDATTLPKKDTLTVDGAVFGLAAHSVDGRQGLVPSWLFEVRSAGAEDALTVTYPAVDPEYLVPRSGEASPRPTGPGDEPTSAPSARDVEVQGYTAEGSELTVRFTGGVCADYEAKAGESGDRVTVTVTETPWPDKVCILIAKEYQLTVQLDRPLGDRRVVGTDGEPVPLQKDGARLPAPPSR
ncbi:hypothetical protein [Streptomyces sp. NWU49]|uniref:hypothetical protein n=1 Tax=Streptomyces sp. NWU49 TaxID=2201153 RepID=UPI00269204B9